MPIDIIGQDRNRGIGKVQMSFLMSARGGAEVEELELEQEHATSMEPL